MPSILPFRRTSSFDELLRPHVDYLYRLAWRFTGSTADAEDLVQDVLIKLYPRKRELDAIERLRPWLAKVLYRQFVDSLRKRARSPLVALPEGEEGEDGLERVQSIEDGPQELYERKQWQERIERALQQLNPEQRAVLAMHDIEGYKLEELEAILEAPLGTLKSRLHRARQRLRELLAVEPFAVAKRVNG